MNNKRREKISDLMEELSTPKDRLETIREEEDDARDNMPESLQNSERYEQSEEASESMEFRRGSIAGSHRLSGERGRGLTLPTAKAGGFSVR